MLTQHPSLSIPVLFGIVAAGSANDELSGDQLDWIALGFLAFIVGGILVGIGLYLRTAYRLGGWKRVGRDFAIFIAIMALWGLKGLIRQYLKLG